MNQDPLQLERPTEQEQILHFPLYANAFVPSSKGRDQENTLTGKIGAAKWKVKVVDLELGVFFPRELYAFTRNQLNCFSGTGQGGWDSAVGAL